MKLKTISIVLNIMRKIHRKTYSYTHTYTHTKKRDYKKVKTHDWQSFQVLARPDGWIHFAEYFGVVWSSNATFPFKMIRQPWFLSSFKPRTWLTFAHFSPRKCESTKANSFFSSKKKNCVWREKQNLSNQRSAHQRLW